MIPAVSPLPGVDHLIQMLLNTLTSGSARDTFDRSVWPVAKWQRASKDTLPSYLTCGYQYVILQIFPSAAGSVISF